MRELQKLIEAIFALIIGIILISALPGEMKLIGAFSFGLIIVAVIILIIFWFIKNFLEDFIDITI